LAQVKTEWVLSLDADYEISSELAAEIRSLDPQQGVVGFEAQFEYRIFGRALRASVYPPKVVLFQPKRCSYYDDGHTQRLRTHGVIRALNGKIYHDDRKPFKRWIDSQQWYAKLEARHVLSTPSEQLNCQDRLRRWIVFAPPAIFLYLLFGRGLILDGWPGWFYVWQRSVAETLLSIQLLTERYNLEPRSSATQNDGTHLGS
jgi:hypothetical protein